MNKLFIALSVLLLSCSQKDKKEPVKENKSTATNKVLLKQPKFQLEHYGDWAVDSVGSVDGALKLNAPSKSSFATVQTFDKAVDEKEFIKKQVDNFVPRLMKDATVGYFTEWGSYKGYGAKIEGYLGVQKTEVKIFTSGQTPTPFAVITQLLVGNRSAEEPGLQLIESSFKMNE